MRRLVTMNAVSVQSFSGALLCMRYVAWRMLPRSLPRARTELLERLAPLHLRPEGVQHFKQYHSARPYVRSARECTQPLLRACLTLYCRFVCLRCGPLGACADKWPELVARSKQSCSATSLPAVVLPAYQL